MFKVTVRFPQSRTSALGRSHRIARARRPDSVAPEANIHHSRLANAGFETGSSCGVRPSDLRQGNCRSFITVEGILCVCPEGVACLVRPTFHEGDCPDQCARDRPVILILGASSSSRYPSSRARARMSTASTHCRSDGRRRPCWLQAFRIPSSFREKARFGDAQQRSLSQNAPPSSITLACASIPEITAAARRPSRSAVRASSASIRWFSRPGP